jgi:hypothetical protein
MILKKFDFLFSRGRTSFINHIVELSEHFYSYCVSSEIPFFFLATTSHLSFKPLLFLSHTISQFSISSNPRIQTSNIFPGGGVIADTEEAVEIQAGGGVGCRSPPSLLIITCLL